MTFDLELTRDMFRALLNVPIPKSGESFIASPDLSEADPGVCRADAAILYGKGKEKIGVIVETQRSPDQEKRYSWLEYIANFRAREKCPACLVVICPNEKVARWAEQEIVTGHPGLTLKVLAIHKWNTPVITDVAQASENIVLAVISTVTQSEHPKFVQIAAAMQGALGGIDPAIACRYARYASLSLKGDARREWNRGMQTMTYPYQDEYADSLRAEGEARFLLIALDKRGIAVSDDLRSMVMRCGDEAVLREWFDRALEAESAEEIFRPEDFEA